MRIRGQQQPLRLHIGCGDKHLEGWVNIDSKPLPGVDVVADVTDGLDFDAVQAVFAEHFLEHLALPDALRFLQAVHRILAADGWLRLSTPNLDWVWETHYRLDPQLSEEDRRLMAVHTNRAFRGWGHRFLWNRELIREALRACGFDDVRECRYGESELPVFCGVERHEIYPDLPELPHVVIVEARKGKRDRKRLATLERVLREEFYDHLAG
ncbi:MAG: methyltransferase domain-containing protein [Acidobacteriota bacterium]|jgi:predicted SAM-dependent methyltransferase